jgi:TrmH family RNA methyltransferase
VAATAGGPVAVVFGRERSGLDNAELARYHLHLRIPANPDYASLNLAAAVQVVAYELRLACGADIPAEPDPDPVTAADMEGLYRHWQDVLTASGFLDPAEPKLLMRRLRRLFNRAAPDRIEINILRGALRSLDPRGGRNRGSGSAGAGLDRGGFGPK